MSKYSHQQCIDITKLQLDVINKKIPLEAAQRAVLEIDSTFPVHNLKSYNARIKKYLSGVGEYGFAFPANWAKALLEVTNNDKLVVQAFKQQQTLYKEKDGKSNQRLAKILKEL